MKYWGYHLMLDCRGMNENVTKKSQIKKFVKDLVKQIDMIAVGPPQIEYLLPKTDNAGYSVVQLIQTSNITAHFTDTGTAYIDIFSCKEFDPEIATALVNQVFTPTNIKSKLLKRQA